MHVKLPDGTSSRSPTAPPASTSRPRSARGWRGDGCREGRRQAAGPASARARRRARSRSCAVGDEDACPCCATRPRTCWPRPRAHLFPGVKSRSARRSTTASTTTSSSRSPSRRGRPRADRGRDARASSDRARVQAQRACRARRRARGSRAEDEPFKVELIDDLPATRASRSRSTSRTTSPTSAAARTCSRRRRSRPSSCLARRRLLARRRERDQLTRIYGTAFCSQADLDEHLHRIEEARRRDHRRLGHSSACSRSTRSRRARRSGTRTACSSGTSCSSTGASRTAGAATARCKHADPLRRRAVEDLRPLGQVPRDTCTRSRSTSGDFA